MEIFPECVCRRWHSLRVMLLVVVEWYGWIRGDARVIDPCSNCIRRREYFVCAAL